MSRLTPNHRNLSEDEKIAKTIVKAQERGRTRNLLIVVAVFSLIIMAFFMVDRERRARVEQSEIERIEACERQHSIIKMQKLFLREHEFIRHLIEDAGVTPPPHDQELLDQLAHLIEEGDCIVGVDVRESN